MGEGLDASAKRIIDQVIDLPEGERDRQIDALCKGDAVLAARVRHLLAAGAKNDMFLNAPTLSGSEPNTPQSEAERPGSRIGPYRILESIGEGGFGTVFMAEQAEPVRRRVALKIIKLGMDTRAVVARFEQERQALAMMDHPNIAKVLDAGSTPTGRPYFVMELVKGEPITEFCDRRNLTVPERLELFVQVCRAVQHAHTKGVIHRDIKPSNVLVSEQDGRPHCRIIDFGIAKATQQPLTEKTVFTEFRQLIGTPEYMSPEQAQGSLDIDTRSDVYALGVLLYELLSGSTPLDPKRLRSAAFGEMQRMIREEDPPAPSTRLSRSTDTLASVAANRRVEPRRLSSIIRGELDWIVMRALEKDRARRYDTAGNLAADVQRFLASEPVHAAPPSRWYLVRKFTRRYRGTVIAAALVIVAVAAGLGVAIWQARVAAGQRDAAQAAAVEADAARRRADQVAEFQASQLRGVDVSAMGDRIRNDVLASARLTMEKAGVPDAERRARQTQLGTLLNDANFTDVARSTLHQSVFARAIKSLESQFADQPLVRAGLLLTIADTMNDLGLVEAAEGPQKEGLAIHQRELGDDNERTINALSNLAGMYREQGRLEEAEPLYRETLERTRRVLGPDHPKSLTALNNTGMFYMSMRKYAEAEACFRQTLEAHRKGGRDSDSTVKSLSNLGLSIYSQNRAAESEAYFREAFETLRRLHGDDHADTLTLMHNLGSLNRALGRYDEAERLLRDVVAKRRRLRGDEHPETLQSINNLGVVLLSMGRASEAESLHREVLDARRRLLGPDHPETVSAQQNMGTLLLAINRPGEAEPLLRSCLEQHERRSGAQTVPTLTCRMHVGESLLAQQRFSDAEPLLLEARLGLLAAPHVPKDVRERCQKSVIDLYEAWEKAEPGVGHLKKAEPFRAAPPAAAPSSSGK